MTGTWVKNSEMDPLTNIFGRLWMSLDGERHGAFYQAGSIPQKEYELDFYWYFEPTRQEAKGDG